VAISRKQLPEKCLQTGADWVRVVQLISKHKASYEYVTLANRHLSLEAVNFCFAGQLHFRLHQKMPTWKQPRRT
jgi:hypothetical protein